MSNIQLCRWERIRFEKTPRPMYMTSETPPAYFTPNPSPTEIA